jgi:glutamate---cysteine ligase / carboxylate-amine ligase
VEHQYVAGRGFSLGIEEELMIVDARTLDLASAFDRLADPDDGHTVKPELHQSVLELATDPAPDAEASGEHLRRLRATVRERAAAQGLRLAAAGTHPFARWEDQRISRDERYRSLIEQLGFVARQEVIFGQHVHVAVDDPEQAIAVANGLRAHVPVIVALSANSPFWMGRDTGMASARLPIFKQFPRVGIPPRYSGWEDWQRRMSFMARAGMVEDHTWFWWDVRIAPRLGTVELRAMDVQTRVEHAIGFAALAQALVRQLCEEEAPPDVPDEILAENKWRAARYGLEGDLVDLPSARLVPAVELARRMLDAARPHARSLGGADALGALDDLLEHGNGAMRQRRIHQANHDFAELVGELADAT